MRELNEKGVEVLHILVMFGWTSFRPLDLVSRVISVGVGGPYWCQSSVKEASCFLKST